MITSGQVISRRAFSAGLGTLGLGLALGGCGRGQVAPVGNLRVHLRLSAYERAFFERALLPDFTRAHNLRVALTDGTTDEAIGQLAAPQPGLDLLAIDSERLGPLIADGLVQPLDGQRAALAVAPWRAMLPGLESGGKLYALPYRPTTWIAFYNRAALDAQGLAPPPTWDAALAAATRLRDSGNPARVALQGAAGEPAARTLAELIWAFGGDPLSPANGGARAAGDFLARLGPALAPLSRDASFASMTTALASGQVALGPNWPVVAADLLQRGGQREIAAYPGPAGPSGGPRLLSGQILVVPRGAANRAGGVALAAYLRDGATQATLARELAWLPAHAEAVAAAPTWQRETAAAAQAALRDARPLPPLAQRPAFDDALGSAFRQIAFERQDPATALARAADAVRGLQ